jgi:hypothetical protein
MIKHMKFDYPINPLLMDKDGKMKNTTLPHSVTLVIIAILAALLLTACASGDDDIEDGVLHLTFDGESCTYRGSTTLKAGPVTLLFFNESEGRGAVDLVRHAGDETIQDALDYFGEEPSTSLRPTWARGLGTFRDIPAGESYTWEGVLEPGIHHMVCVRWTPYGVWFGTGLMVED